MATCENFKITLHNSTDAEVRVKKFEYKDGSRWKTEEGIFGVDGHQKIERGHGVTFTRNLGGVGDETTQFRVTYEHHIGGTLWGDDISEVTAPFTAHDNGSKTVTLTR